MTSALVFYAPNVHTGGGLVLLRALLSSWPKSLPFRAFLDERAKSGVDLPEGANVYWVKPRIDSRLIAEIALREHCKLDDTVLCFHGLPPVLPNLGRVVVYQQNRLLLNCDGMSGFPMHTAARLAFERLVSRMFRRRVSEYLVQTPSMARDLIRWYGMCGSAPEPTVRVLPFGDELPSLAGAGPGGFDWDFVYVADGGAHKNHRQLMEAWKLLAKQGTRPKLALTLGACDVELIKIVDVLRVEYGAEVYNLGGLSYEQVLALYRRTRALIFASVSESFGLPMIEAKRFGLPILAAELDFVRDVCEPAQTFDPHSAISIARAVNRFLARPEPPLVLHSPQEFWGRLLGNAKIGEL